MIRRLTEEDYRVSTWSGGRTIQLAIAPEESVYADRDFLWRVSSATVDLESSDFTALPDYERLITPISGEMVLTHDGGEPIPVPIGMIHRFDGASATHSRGCCTDFNLMLRKGKTEGSMMRLVLKAEEERRIQVTQGSCLIFCAQGRVAVKESGEEIRAGESILTDEQVVLAAEETSELMAAWAWQA